MDGRTEYIASAVMNIVDKFALEEKIRHDYLSDCRQWLTSRMVNNTIRLDAPLQIWLKNPSIKNKNRFQTDIIETTNMISNCIKEVNYKKLRYKRNPKTTHATFEHQKNGNLNHFHHCQIKLFKKISVPNLQLYFLPKRTKVEFWKVNITCCVGD